MSGARTFRLTVAYDGTAFHGWQKQPGTRTVQGELEAALARILECGQVLTAGAGRTDAGVHARGQVASFVAETHLPAKAFAPLLRRELPADMRVSDCREMPEGFHARHRACERRYEYRLLDAPDVLRERYAWAPSPAPPLPALAAAAAPLVGTHDFTTFQSVSEDMPDPVCRVRVAQWRAGEHGPVFEIAADHFLYHMVRNLVGTMVELAAAPEGGPRMQALLDARDRARRGRTAPACGLSLEAVVYEGEECA